MTVSDIILSYSLTTFCGRYKVCETFTYLLSSNMGVRNTSDLLTVEIQENCHPILDTHLLIDWSSQAEKRAQHKGYLSLRYLIQSIEPHN